MAKNLVVVESPTKVRTISKYLGKNFTVKASVGHVIDLPKSKLGVEIKDDHFEPVYEVIKGKKKVIDEIKKASKGVETVYLAPDPDREGEAIAWHIAEQLQGKRKKKDFVIRRVLIEEITKKGVERALAAPQDLNLPRFESQQARRILDRLVGYQVSPILWEKVRRGLSAGRVQSVALRIVCEREREIQAFTPVEYWSIEADLLGKTPPPFTAKLAKKDGEKIEIGNEEESQALVSDLEKQDYIIQKIVKKDRRRNPPAPFTTSTLQQEAARKLGFTARRTMMVAQQLYEGIELGAEGPVGLITYMRTDSTRLSEDALNGARGFIEENYGKKYLPDSPRVFKTSKRAQDAHEAIRPTLMHETPEKLNKLLKRDQLRLYRLIWDRFVACQMKQAIYDQVSIDIKAGIYDFRATGSHLKFDGFMKLYVEGQDNEGSEEADLLFPQLKEGEKLKLKELKPEQHFTKPPPRYTEASLVKELEENGIGRPSTYASILSTLQSRKYVEKDQRNFLPTELGFLICDLLVENFPEIFNVKFTAQMETDLDQIEEGEKDWQEALRDFYDPFAKSIKVAKKKMRDIKREETPTDLKCEKCDSPMVIKWGRHGHFLACTGYPDCKNTKEFKRDEDGKIQIVEQPEVDEKCEKCGAPMVMKTGRFGKFLACSKYPDCKNTQSISTGVKCPEKGCKGNLVERRTRRGRVFYGCSAFPKCKHALWNKPVAEKCPDCGAPYLAEKFTKKDGAHLQCVNKECGFKRSLEESSTESSSTKKD